MVTLCVCSPSSSSVPSSSHSVPHCLLSPPPGYLSTPPPPAHVCTRAHAHVLPPHAPHHGEVHMRSHVHVCRMARGRARPLVSAGFPLHDCVCKTVRARAQVAADASRCGCGCGYKKECGCERVPEFHSHGHLCVTLVGGHWWSGGGGGHGCSALRARENEC